MILQIVDNIVRPERIGEYLAAAKEFAADSTQNDPGCVRTEVFRKQQQPDHVYIISLWQNEAAMQSAAAFLRHKAALKPAFVSNETTILHTVD